MDTITDLYDAQGRGPKYRALANAIREGVRARTLQPGAQLPPVRDLAWRLGMTPGTVARAYALLTDEGVLTAAVGRGTFVADATRPPDQPMPEPPWPITGQGRDERVSFVAPRLPDCGQADLVRAAFARLAQLPQDRLLNYPTRAGFRSARIAALSWLAETPLGPVEEEDIVLSHGGQNGISLAMQTVLRGSRPVVLVEELSYPGFRRAAELLRAEVVPVPMDEAGLVPEALDRAAARHGAQLLCTSPEVHNPTTRVTPAARRDAIAAIAARRGFHVLEDDCYRIGARTAPSYRALLPEQGWHVASISKSITPALRVGFVVAPKGARAGLRRSAEHGFFGLAQPLAELVTWVLSDPGLPGILDAVRDRYAAYIRVAVAHLSSFDLLWREDVPFVWLTLPPGWRVTAFARAAEAAGVQLRAADEFALRDGPAPHAVRIAINAQVSLEDFTDAMGRLRHLLVNPPEAIAV